MALSPSLGEWLNREIHTVKHLAVKKEMSSQATERCEGTRQNCGASRKVSGCQEEMNVGSTGDF